MATTKSARTKSSKPEAKDVAIKAQLTTAQIIQPSDKDRYADIDIPDFLKEEGALAKEAPTGFTPLIAFGDNAHDWKVGSWIIARFLASRDNVGPNNSYMYDFEVTANGKQFQPASLWGSTILDNKMKLLNPTAGDWVFIQYLGTTTTSRGMNPAKDFRLAIVDYALIKKMGFVGK